MNEKQTVLLIDLSSLFWTASHAVGKDKPVSEVTDLTLSALRRAAGDHTGPLAICLDQGRSFRKFISPEYKANRPEKDHAALNELATLKDKLRAQGRVMWGQDGMEADDIIATATVQAAAAGHPVRIVSSDKDLLQLCDIDGVEVLRSYGAWETWGRAKVLEKYGVDVRQLGDWLALVGDSSDNIKGCPGVGPKTATGLLKKFGSIDALYAAIDALGTATMTPAAREIATPAGIEKLKAHKKDVEIARKLVTLKTDCSINFGELFETRTPKQETRSIDLDKNDKFSDDRISGGVPGKIPTGVAPVPPAEAATAVHVAPGDGGEPGTISKDIPAPAAAKTATVAANDSAAGASGEPAITSVVKYEPPQVSFERALEPMSPGQALKMAEMMYESRAFVRFPTPGAICAALIGGRELGLGAIASTNAFWFIQELGCLALKAHTIAEMITRHPKCQYLRLVHSDYDYAEYETKHKDHPEPFRWRYSVQDAIDAGRCTKDIVPRKSMQEKDNRSQWDKDRKNMLRKTAVVQLGRIVYPGCAAGFYSLEELTNGGDE